MMICRPHIVLTEATHLLKTEYTINADHLLNQAHGLLDHNIICYSAVSYIRRAAIDTCIAGNNGCAKGSG